jgi:hypothetical protein
MRDNVEADEEDIMRFRLERAQRADKSFRIAHMARSFPTESRMADPLDIETGGRWEPAVVLMMTMEAARSSESSVNIYQAIRRHFPKDIVTIAKFSNFCM